MLSKTALWHSSACVTLLFFDFFNNFILIYSLSQCCSAFAVIPLYPYMISSNSLFWLSLGTVDNPSPVPVSLSLTSACISCTWISLILSPTCIWFGLMLLRLFNFFMDISTDLYYRWPAFQLLEKTMLYKEWVGSFYDAWVAIFNAFANIVS